MSFQLFVWFLEEIFLEIFSLFETDLGTVFEKFGLSEQMLRQPVLVNLMNQILRLPEVHFSLSAWTPNFIGSL